MDMKDSVFYIWSSAYGSKSFIIWRTCYWLAALLCYQAITGTTIIGNDVHQVCSILRSVILLLGEI